MAKIRLIFVMRERKREKFTPMLEQSYMGGGVKYS